MFNFSENEEKITIKCNTIFLAIGIAAIFMAGQGISLLSDLQPLKDGTSVLGFTFVCVWVLVVICLGLFSFIENSKQIIINKDGVLCKSWVYKKFISWVDIKDWGLSYCGKTKGEGNTYYLYFSEHICETKNECKKILKGKMIKTNVFGDDYSVAAKKVIPFCQQKATTPPFIGKDKFHLF